MKKNISKIIILFAILTLTACGAEESSGTINGDNNTHENYQKKPLLPEVDNGKKDKSQENTNTQNRGVNPDGSTKKLEEAKTKDIKTGEAKTKETPKSKVEEKTKKEPSKNQPPKKESKPKNNSGTSKNTNNGGGTSKTPTKNTNNGIPKNAKAKLVLIDGFDGTLYHSIDGGKKWTKGTVAPVRVPTKIAILQIAKKHYLVSTMRGELVETLDEGKTWEKLNAAPWSKDGRAGGNAHHIVLSKDNKNYLYAASSHYHRQGILYKSDDLGRTWISQSQWKQKTGMMIDMLVGNNGNAYVSHTPLEGAQVYKYDGKGFGKLNEFDNSRSGAIALISQNSKSEIFTVGNPETSFFISRDAGKSWSKQGSWLSPRSIQAFSIDFNDIFYAISVKGDVVTSDDNGKSWTRVGDWGKAATRNIISGSGWIDLTIDYY